MSETDYAGDLPVPLAMIRDDSPEEWEEVRSWLTSVVDPWALAGDALREARVRILEALYGVGNAPEAEGVYRVEVWEPEGWRTLERAGGRGVGLERLGMLRSTSVPGRRYRLVRFEVVG